MKKKGEYDKLVVDEGNMYVLPLRSPSVVVHGHILTYLTVQVHLQPLIRSFFL